MKSVKVDSILIYQILICFAMITLSLGRNCKGKAFICLDKTHFRVCVEDGKGGTKTVDTEVQKCPENSICDNDLQFECSVVVTPEPTTTVTTTTKRRRRTTVKKLTRKPITKKPTKKPVTKKPTKTPETEEPIITKTTPKPKTRITRKPVEARCPRSGWFGNPNDCHFYYTCAGSERLKFYCPFNTVFSESSGTCDHDKDLCKNNNFKCPGRGRFEDPKSCYHYFECKRNGDDGFKSTRFLCPFFNSYNKDSKRCEFGHFACSDRVFP